MTPLQAAALLRKRADALKANCRRALNDTVKVGVKLGRANSSGLFSLDQLAKAGHPYSVRRPNPSYPDMIINVQTGRFRSAWKPVAASAFRGGLRAWIVNHSPEASFLTGRNRPRSRMIRRPVDDLTMIDTDPFFTRNVRAAVRKALRA